MRVNNMNISVNGQSRVPPGFRFHPTEEELLQYYLRKKVANEKIDLDVIFEVDLNKLEPWDIIERCKIGTTPQNDWYFFSHKDKKYPTGTRTNRATMAGFWKATGRDKVIYSNSRRIGMRKTLVFYKGRAPHGQKSDWIMHEYRLDENTNFNNDIHVTSDFNGDLGQEEGWVVCRIFKKKSHHKALCSPSNNTSISITLETHSSIIESPSDRDRDRDHDHDHHDQGALEQIFQFMGTKPQKNNNNNSNQEASYYQPLLQPQNDVVSKSRISGTDNHPNSVFDSSGLGDWAALDRFIATHLNGQATETLPPFDHDHHHHDLQLPPLISSSSSTSPGNKIYQPAAATLNNYGGNEIDQWSFMTSSLPIDPLCHVSEAGI